MHFIQYLAVLFLAGIGTLPIILGDFSLKLSADNGNLFSWHTLLGALAYAISAPIWVWIMMKNVDLIQVGILFSAMILIGLPLVGVLWFQETMTRGQLIAIGLVLIAIPLSEYVK